MLARSKPELARRFGVVRLALFGSMAWDEAHPGSDVDIVVSFNGPATSQRYFGVQFYLEDALGCPVDLVTEKALRDRMEESRMEGLAQEERGAFPGCRIKSGMTNCMLLIFTTHCKRVLLNNFES